MESSVENMHTDFRAEKVNLAVDWHFATFRHSIFKTVYEPTTVCPIYPYTPQIAAYVSSEKEVLN